VIQLDDHYAAARSGVLISFLATLFRLLMAVGSWLLRGTIAFKPSVEAEIVTIARPVSQQDPALGMLRQWV